ncbi:copper amine oxidase N-terminal domain-containing protein [Paenibacillus macerans]|uniref:copper amine oxidase N-terminal domain-containing protein n=1 Tax=Paenibacillus macerans TaxID=44252 RepID=UPI002DBDDA4F|nr:copper amine oxidase N-terminal domain-containing protein [Paenibacillus macerans]MEC0329177.1 copper amine oxidase N-terminal domain-containing protein [Paenibacillus macerans]
MKKIVYLTLTGFLAAFIGLFSFTAPTSAAAPASYTLYVDGKLSSAKFPTVVEKNVTLIPLKPVLTDLGYTTTVDSKTKAVTATNSDGSSITVKTGSKKAQINGSDATLPAVVKTMNGTTYLPLSAIKQLTGKPIGLDASKAIAWIGDKPAKTVALPPWGATPKQMKAIFSHKQLIEEGQEGDIYALWYQEAPDYTDEIYVFYKNKLAKWMYDLPVPNYDEAGLISYYDGMLESLVNKYGEPETNIAAADKNNQPIPLADGGYFMSEWIIGGTKITLFLKPADAGYVMNIQYVDTSVESKVKDALDAL